MIGKENRSTRRKPAPVLLCPPQTPHAARTRTRAAAVWSLARWIHFIPPYSISLRSILVLSSHLSLYLTNGLFLPFLPIRAACPCHFSLLELIILITFDEEYKLWSSSLCNFLQSPVTSSLFGPNILLNTLVSNTLSLCSSLKVRDQVSHP
jgi:hypothetical protein